MTSQEQPDSSSPLLSPFITLLLPLVFNLSGLSNSLPCQFLLAAALVAWTVRLGTFLAQRAIETGGDSRFDEIKHGEVEFAGMWIA